MNTFPRTRRWTTGAAVVYVLAWLTGLPVAPLAPGGSAAADQIHAHYLEHGGQVLTQALLMHGVAGLALAILAVGTTRLSQPGAPLRTGAALSGLGAAAVSLAQEGIAVLFQRRRRPVEINEAFLRLSARPIQASPPSP
jgi:hypothetical protein